MIGIENLSPIFIFHKNYFAIGNEKRGIDRFTTVAKKLGTTDRILSLPTNYDVIDQISEIDFLSS